MHEQYEYKVISLFDGKKIKTTGSVPVDELEAELNRLGTEGWHVVGGYASPHSSSAGIQICQNILVLERRK